MEKIKEQQLRKELHDLRSRRTLINNKIGAIKKLLGEEDVSNNTIMIT